MELSVKMETVLQRTMVIPQEEKGSSAEDATGDLPSGEIPGASEASASGYLPSGEIPEMQPASVPEDLPSGKISESQAAELTEDLPSGEITVKEAKEEDVEMEAPKEEEVPQDEHMQDDEEVDYAESEVSSTTVNRANELLNAEYYEMIAGEGSEDGEVPIEQRPRRATPAMARFIKHMLHEDLGRIDHHIARNSRQRFHEQQREEERRNDPAMEVEEPAAQATGAEVKIYQEELESGKGADIFAQPSSAEFLKLLPPEAESTASSAQENLEELFVKRGIQSYSKPFRNKMPESLDRPLEKEPRVRVSVPEPQPCGEEQVHDDYDCALDGLAVLDKYGKSGYFGFYGKGFRWTHNKALNFMKSRKGNIEHPCAKFGIDEKKLVEVYCQL